jgi:hypothetical protein
LANLAAASATTPPPPDSDLDADSNLPELDALDSLLEDNVLDDDIRDLLAADPTALLAATTTLANANNPPAGVDPDELAEKINRDIKGYLFISTHLYTVLAS